MEPIIDPRNSIDMIDSSDTDHLSDDQQHRLASLLDQYLIDLERGHDPDRDSLIAANADLRDSLFEAMESIDLLHRVEITNLGTKPSVGETATPNRSKPEQVGKFRIGDELGRGAMGVVYSVVSSHTEDALAIKLLLGTWSRESHRIERFRREAHAARSLQHPNIIPVYEVGFADGYHYYTMRRIEGVSLSQWIPTLRHSNYEGEYSYKRLAFQLAEIADALHAAHSAGIVHRDVKPSNVLVDADSNMWITDFGLAQVDDGASLTRSGDLVGTFHYMSPEQASGKPETVDRRTDIYSFGVTLYEVFTGRQPFQELVGAHLIRAILTTEPARPRNQDRRIPINLETIIQRSMRPEKADRYASAAELAEDLRRFATGQRIRAARVTPLERITRLTSKHSGIVLFALALAVIAMAALGIHNIVITQEIKNRIKSETDRDQNYKQARNAVDQLGMKTSELLRMVPGAERIRQEQLATTLRYYELFVKRSESDRLLVDDVAQTRLKIAQLQRLIGNTPKAISAYEQATRELSEAFRSNRDQQTLVAWVRALNELALMQLDQRDIKSAKASLNTASTAIAKIEAQRARSIAEALLDNNRGIVAIRNGETTQAVDAATRAVGTLSKLIDSLPSNPENGNDGITDLKSDMADALGNLSFSLNESGLPKEAIQLAEKSLALRQDLNKVIGATEPGQLRRLAVAFNNLAALQWKGQDVQRAISAYRSAIELLEKAVLASPGQTEPQRELAVTLNNLGMALASVLDRDEAGKNFRRAIAIASQASAADPMSAEIANLAAGVWNNLGILLRDAGDPRQALEAFDQAIRYQKRVCEINPRNEEATHVLQMFQENRTFNASENSSL